jgi:FkbM family methyltransferase
VKELLKLIEYYSTNENLTNETVCNFMEEAKTKRVCLFGAGIHGRMMASFLENMAGIKVDFFCDNDTSKCNNTFNYKNIPCFSYEKLKVLHGNTVVLVTAGKAFEIAAQLETDNIKYYLPLDREILYREFWQSNNISDYRDVIIESYRYFKDEFSKKLYIKCLSAWFNGKFESFEDVYSSDQYFLKDVMPLDGHESFVDIGSFNGDTIQKFLEVTNNIFDAIYAFELENRSFMELENYVSELPLSISNKIKIYNIGIGECHETIRYHPQEIGSFVTTKTNTGLIEAKLAPLDDIVHDKITFIKMDIEGAELSALKGAKKTIQKYKPKLAICVYHKPQDLWKIPLYIKELNPDYELSLRHHTGLKYDTVCYAI